MLRRLLIEYRHGLRRFVYDTDARISKQLYMVLSQLLNEVWELRTILVKHLVERVGPTFVNITEAAAFLAVLESIVDFLGALALRPGS